MTGESYSGKIRLCSAKLMRNDVFFREGRMSRMGILQIQIIVCSPELGNSNILRSVLDLHFTYELVRQWPNQCQCTAVCPLSTRQNHPPYVPVEIVQRLSCFQSYLRNEARSHSTVRCVCHPASAELVPMDRSLVCFIRYFFCYSCWLQRHWPLSFRWLHWQECWP